MSVVKSLTCRSTIGSRSQIGLRSNETPRDARADAAAGVAVDANRPALAGARRVRLVVEDPAAPVADAARAEVAGRGAQKSSGCPSAAGSGTSLERSR